MKCVPCMVRTVSHGKLFSIGSKSLTREGKASQIGSGLVLPAEVSTEATMQRVEQIIHNDRHVAIDDIERAVDYSHGTCIQHHV